MSVCLLCISSLNACLFLCLYLYVCVSYVFFISLRVSLPCLCLSVRVLALAEAFIYLGGFNVSVRLSSGCLARFSAH